MNAKTLKTKALAAAMAVAVAATAFGASTTDAEAGKKGRFLTGLAVGALATGLVASEAARRRERRNRRVIIVRERPVYRAPRRVYRPAYGGRHAACAAKYASYNPNTGLYLSYSGVYRPCRL